MIPVVTTGPQFKRMVEAMDEPWKRLAQLLIARRVELGYHQRADWVRHLGVKQPRTIEDFEKARRTNYRPSTIALIERYYGWEPGSIDAVLAGGDPTPVPGVGPRVPPVALSRADLISRVINARPPGVPENVEVHSERGEPYMLVTEVTTREGLEATRRTLEYVIGLYKDELASLGEELTRLRALTDVNETRHHTVMGLLDNAEAVVKIIRDKEAALGEQERPAEGRILRGAEAFLEERVEPARAQLTRQNWRETADRADRFEVMFDGFRVNAEQAGIVATDDWAAIEGRFTESMRLLKEGIERYRATEQKQAADG